MKRLTALLALSTVSFPAFAADLIEYEPFVPPPVVVAPPSWTGLYLGGQAGYAFGSNGNGLGNVFVTLPGMDGTPGTPPTPGTPGTEPVVIPGGSQVQFSWACAQVVIDGDPVACSYAVEGDGVEYSRADVSLEEATAEQERLLGGQVSGDVVRATSEGVTVGEETITTEGEVVIPGTPGTPGTLGTPGTPAVPSRVVSLNDLPGYMPGYERFSDNDDGFIGGVHIGYDQQLGYSIGTGALVIGAVADLSYVDVERFGGVTNGIDTISVQEELDYLATLRLRAGVGYESVLIYATGGLAFGEVNTTIVNTLFNDSASQSDTRFGYAVGGGVDFLVTPNLTFGVEYLYTDLGSDDFSRSYDLPGVGTLNVVADEDFDFHTVWAKASYRFN